MCLSVHWEEDKLAPREARGLALFTPHTRGVPGAQLPCGHLRGQLERCLHSPASSPSRPISPPSLLVCPTRRSTRYAPLGEKKNHEFFLTAHFLKHEKETFHKCFLKQTTGRGSAALAGRSPHCGISQTREVRWYMGTKVPARDSPGIALGTQASPGSLQQSLDPQPSWAGGKAWASSHPFHREETEAREVESCSFSGEALLYLSFIIPDSFTSGDLFFQFEELGLSSWRQVYSFLMCDGYPRSGVALIGLACPLPAHATLCPTPSEPSRGPRSVPPSGGHETPGPFPFTLAQEMCC